MRGTTVHPFEDFGQFDHSRLFLVDSLERRRSFPQDFLRQQLTASPLRVNFGRYAVRNPTRRIRVQHDLLWIVNESVILYSSLLESRLFIRERNAKFSFTADDLNSQVDEFNRCLLLF